MKLAEALIERADKQRYLAELRVRMFNNAKYQEGEEPAEEPRALLQVHDQVLRELETLIIAINRTNNQISLEDGMGMLEALTRRTTLKARHSVYKDLAQAAIPQQTRYSQAEIKMVRAVDVAALQKQADAIAKEVRELDIRIQQANWAHDIIT